MTALPSSHNLDSHFFMLTQPTSSITSQPPPSAFSNLSSFHFLNCIYDYDNIGYCFIQPNFHTINAVNGFVQF